MSRFPEEPCGCGQHKHKNCHEHKEAQEALQFPSTKIYRCFNPGTCDNYCVLCQHR